MYIVCSTTSSSKYSFVAESKVMICFTFFVCQSANTILHLQEFCSNLNLGCFSTDDRPKKCVCIISNRFGFCICTCMQNSNNTKIKYITILPGIENYLVWMYVSESYKISIQRHNHIFTSLACTIIKYFVCYSYHILIMLLKSVTSVTYLHRFYNIFSKKT